MNNHRKYALFDQCSVCCMWVDFNAGAAHAACPACPYRDEFAESAARRRAEADRTSQLEFAPASSATGGLNIQTEGATTK